MTQFCFNTRIDAAYHTPQVFTRIVNQAMPDSEKIIKIVKVNTVFTPSQPIALKELFAGRFHQLEKANSSIIEPGLHIAIYGDRGVGKTSLANVIEKVSKSIENNQIICTKVSCDPFESFNDLWIKSFSQIIIPVVEEQKILGFTNNQENDKIVSNKTLSQHLNWNTTLQEDIKVSDLVEVMKQISIPNVFIFDEFDRIEDHKIKEKFTYLIKSLSDNCFKTTIVVVGIAENIIDLVKNHESIERCLRQIQLPRMSEEELTEIIDRGLNHINLSIEDNVKKDIVQFSEGFPQFVHLLMKYASIATINSNKQIIEKSELTKAVNEAIEDMQEIARNSYYKAVRTVKANTDSSFKEVIIACAFAKTDEYGSFRSADIQEPLLKITGQKRSTNSYAYNLGKLCEEERGAILKKIKFGKQFRFKFKNPIMKAFIKLKAYQLELSKDF